MLRSIPLILMSICMATHLQGADTAVAPDARARVILTLRQPVLVERAAMGTCFAMSGISGKSMDGVAREALDTMATVLDGLTHGHDWLALVPEIDAELRGQMAAMQDDLRSFSVSSQQILAGDLHSVVMAQFLTGATGTLSAANQLAHDVSKRHGGGVFDRGHSAALHAAADHLALSQQVMRLSCLALADIGGAHVRKTLHEAIATFDAGFDALAHGQGAVVAAPNARVARHLRTAKLFWDKIAPVLTRIAGDETVTETDVQKALKLNASILKQLNQAVEAYLVPV